MKNDGHDTDVPYASRWLKQFLELRMTIPAFSKDTLFVVTFDEDDSKTEQNRVFTVIFGPDIKWSSNVVRIDNRYYDHYSLLRTIQDNVRLGRGGWNNVVTGCILLTTTYIHLHQWDLGDLGGHDKDAAPFEF